MLMKDALGKAEDPSQFTSAKLNGTWTRVINGNDSGVKVNLKAV